MQDRNQANRIGRTAVLSGALGQGNFGDESLADAFEALHSANYRLILRLVDGPPQNSRQVRLPVMAVGRQRMLGVLQRRRVAGAIGSLAGHGNIDYIWLGGLLGEPAHILARESELNWAASFASRFAYYFGDAESKILDAAAPRSLVDRLNTQSNWIGVRSEGACDVLRKWGITAPIFVGTDAVLAERLQAIANEGFAKRLEELSHEDGAVVLCPAGSSSQQGMLQGWISIAEHFANSGRTIIWAAQHPEFDLAICQMAMSRVNSISQVKQRLVTGEALATEIAAASACITARFHCAVFAISARVSTVGIGWNDKIKRLYSDVGLNDCLLAANLPSEQLASDAADRVRNCRVPDETRVRAILGSHNLSLASFIGWSKEEERSTAPTTVRHLSTLRSELPPSRTTRSILTFVSSSCFTVISTLIGLVATPYLLRWLGDERFGAFRALSEWMGYLVLLELGLTGATMTVLAKALSQSESAAAAAMRVCMRAFTRAAVGMLLGALVLTAAAPWLVPVSDSLRGDLRLAAVVLAAGVLLVPFAPLRLLLDTAQRGYVVNSLLIVNSIVLTTLALVFAHAGAGIAGQAAATVTATAAFTSLLGIYVYRRWLRTHPAARDDGTWKNLLWKNNWQTVVLDVTGRMALLSDNIIIGAFLGPAAVTPFLLTQRLIQVGAGQVLGIGNSSWAAMANLFHTDQHELLRQRLIELSRLTAVLAGIVIVPLVAYNHAFVRLWVGERSYAGDAVTILAGVVGLFAGWWSLWGWVFRGAGILKPVIPTSIASAAVNVTVSIALTAGLGWMEGPLIGTVAGFMTVTAWRYPLMFQRHLGLSPARLGLAIAPVVLLFAAGGAAAWSAARTWPPQTWLGLIACIIAAATAYALVALLLIVSKEERQIWRQRLSLLWGSKS